MATSTIKLGTTTIVPNRRAERCARIMVFVSRVNGPNADYDAIVRREECVTFFQCKDIRLTSALAHAEHLTVELCTNVDLGGLFGMKSLRELVLSKHHSVGLHLSVPPSLKKVVLHDSELIVFSCKRNTCVETLHVHDTLLPYEHVLSKMQGLRHLDVIHGFRWGKLHLLEHRELVDVSLSHVTVRHVGHLPSIKSMSLCVRYIPTGWTHATTLTSLDLVFNTFGSMRFLSALVNLESLSLRIIGFLERKPVSLRSLQFLHKLRVLTLRGFPVWEEPPTGTWCRELRKVTIWACGLSTVPAFVFMATKMTELSLSNNHIPVIPEDIHQLGRLQILDLADNNLDGFPVHVTGLKSLKKLYLQNAYRTRHDGFHRVEGSSFNCITAIPADIQYLRNLRVLQLSGTGLSSLPVELYELYKMEELHLFQNLLTSMPSGISKMEGLKILMLNSNDLDCLPEDLFACPSLERVHACETNLTYLPEGIHKAPRLWRLHVSDTRLKKLPCSIGDIPVSMQLHNTDLEQLPLSMSHLLTSGNVYQGSFHTPVFERLFQDLFERRTSRYWAWSLRHEFPHSTATFQALVLLCAKRGGVRLPLELWCRVFSFFLITDFTGCVDYLHSKTVHALDS